MAEHTPTPWALLGRGDIIGVCKGFPQKPVAKVLGQETSAERAANIALIIKAVNNHEALLECVKDLIDSYNWCSEDPVDRGYSLLSDNVMEAKRLFDRITADVGQSRSPSDG